MHLSIIIPVFNEVKLLPKIFFKIFKETKKINKEIIIIDDNSNDGTKEWLSGLKNRFNLIDIKNNKLIFSKRKKGNLQIFLKEKNEGKGSAVKIGLKQSSKEIIVIQDADMEYNPAEFRWLLQPILDDRADVVYGSRFSSPDHAVSPGWHRAGNQFITRCFNFVIRLRFTDVETCYKMFRREVIQELAPRLKENRFGIEIEMTAKLARRGDIRFFERPISYARRSYAEGKKIGWRDGVRALWRILRYGFGK